MNHRIEGGNVRIEEILEESYNTHKKRRHLVEDKELNINNEDDNLPYLVDCKGCEYNIGRKLNKNKCFIYIEKDIATTFKGRSETTEVGGLKTFKPYMTHENIFRQNDLVNKNVVTNICIDKNNNMSIDEEDEDLIDNYILLQIGTIIQKGDEWSLDGMFALEIFAKNSSVEKFNFDVDEHQEVTKKMTPPCSRNQTLRFGVLGGLPKNGKWRTKVPSGGLPKNGKRRTKVRSVRWSSEEWKTEN
ncbi:hypothetical protein RhiirC2_782914 [Rhizophagus irregularis]|uniref:Uncharacterized protein n=1 Tax=Rhizophagus irregularis TaxID=588596 RepID=A0A2N1N1Y7_9GLOM|nr:hypothetical protein RhiirC2_782914 [Rhizophagus irregularis]